LCGDLYTPINWIVSDGLSNRKYTKGWLARKWAGMRGLDERKENMALAAAATVPCSSTAIFALCTASSRCKPASPVKPDRSDVDWNRSPTPRRSRICRHAQRIWQRVTLMEAQQCQLSLLQIYEFPVTWLCIKPSHALS
jgi:hypothetical protein